MFNKLKNHFLLISFHIKYSVILVLCICLGCADNELGIEESICTPASEHYFNPSNRTFIPPLTGDDMISFCSRSFPTNVEGYYDLSFDRICQVQQSLGQLLPVIEASCFSQNSNIDLDAYYYQFLGLIIDQTEHVFINAFSLPAEDTSKLNPEWKTIFIDTCGGGTNFWSSLFNLSTGEFSDFEANIHLDRVVLEPGPENEIYLCTRCLGFKNHTYFSLSEDEVCSLESNFEKLENIKARTCNFVGAKINFSYPYFYQYIGIIIDNEKFIYINGQIIHDGEIYSFLYDRFVAGCDGGTTTWGVLYNLDTKEFSQIQFDAVR